MTQGRIVIDGDDQMYTLADEGGRLRMSVLVSASMYNDDIVFVLTAAEVAEYRMRGRSYLDDLARNVRRCPSTFRARGLDASGADLG